MVAKILFYFLFSVVVYMGVTSFTSHMMEPEASTMTGVFLAVIAFTVVFGLSFLKKKDKGEKKGK